jgi:purine nucleosidase
MKRIIIDCDPGIDDAQAIMMAYRHLDVTIEAITTVAGNVDLEHTTANALKILDVLEAGPIPVYPGANTGLVEQEHRASFVHGEDGLGDAGIAESARACGNEPAALALIRLGRTSSGELELIAIGPLTNLALAIRIDPELPIHFKRLVIMGGAYLAQGNTPNYPAEFNIFADPEAAKVVFDNWPKFTMVSWDATIDHGIPFDLYQELFSLDNPGSAFLAKVSRKMLHFIQNRIKGEMSYAADPLAMAVLIEPEIIQDSVDKYVQIEMHGSLTRGMTVVDWFDRSDRAPNVNIVRKVDAERFMALFRLAFE